jgi:hypothetical protein
MNGGRVIAGILSLTALAGCQRGVAPAEAPATAPISQAPATRPDAATLLIDHQTYWFPPAVLRLAASHGKLSARLSTDDPPTAIEQDYRGNSFDLTLPLNIDDPALIDQAACHVATGGLPKRESDRGIFLDGQHRRLHPQDTTAQFHRQGDKIVVTLSGYFLLYQNSPLDRSFASPQRVYVQGQLAASVPEK